MNTMEMSFRLLLLTGMLLSAFHLNAVEAEQSAFNNSQEEADEAELVEDEADETATTPSQGENEYWEALLKFTTDGDQSFEEGRKLLLKAAEKEFPPAQNFLGGCYLEGIYGFPQKKRKAADYFQLAAERGYPFAQINLGRCYLAGIGVWKDEDKALHWLEEGTAENPTFKESPPPAWYIEKIQDMVSEQNFLFNSLKKPYSDFHEKAKLIYGLMSSRIGLFFTVPVKLEIPFGQASIRTLFSCI